MDDKFIEEIFPVSRVSENSAREKRNVNNGSISALHIWWARKPVGGSRATIYASLIPKPDESLLEIEKKSIMEELSDPKVIERRGVLEQARKDITMEYGRQPRILDPFGGGGSIPLAAQQLGCEAHSMDLNPVAVLIQKCTLEYPYKYNDKEDKWRDTQPRLIKDLQVWGERLQEEVEKELARFYPQDPDGSTPTHYIWARTLPCQNPECQTQIPLLRNYWLVRKKNKRIALQPQIEANKINFKVVGDGHEPIPDDFDPTNGTISRAIVKCPACGSMIPAERTRELFKTYQAGEQIIAVVTKNPNKRGKKYRTPTLEDIRAYLKAKEYLKEKRKTLEEEWMIDPIPTEPLPPKRTLIKMNVQNYLDTWGDLFNDRQKLTLIILIEKIRMVYRAMLDEGHPKDHAEIITTYLALIISKLTIHNSSLSIWQSDRECNVNVFGLPTLGMVWGYAERNPISTGIISTDHIIKVLEGLYNGGVGCPGRVTQGSARRIPYPDEYFDAVFTDPPYYDNIGYSHLSDFFYVWLRRALGDIHPDLFITTLTPKKEEMVAYPQKHGEEDARKRFEEMFLDALQEIGRILKPGGVAYIVYAHKSIIGWDAAIKAIMDSGLRVTATWPIGTERKRRLRAQGSSALSSSIYIIVRKPDTPTCTGYYEEVRGELRARLNHKLESLWNEGVMGPDFLIAAIGAGLEIIGGYKEIINYNGERIETGRLIEEIRELAADFTLNHIIKDGSCGELTPLTRFYILYRWNYGRATIDFDEGRKLAASTGVYLTNIKSGFIRIQGGKMKLLGPEDRTQNYDDDLIDVLHLAARLWSEGERDELQDLLTRTGYGVNENFYRVAQAIIEFLPSCKEKQWLEGLILNKEAMIKSLREKQEQKTLQEN